MKRSVVCQTSLVDAFWGGILNTVWVAGGTEEVWLGSSNHKGMSTSSSHSKEWPSDLGLGTQAILVGVTSPWWWYGEEEPLWYGEEVGMGKSKGV